MINKIYGVVGRLAHQLTNLLASLHYQVQQANIDCPIIQSNIVFLPTLSLHMDEVTCLNFIR